MKSLFLIPVFLIFYTNSFCQGKLMHSFGATISYLNAKTKTQVNLPGGVSYVKDDKTSILQTNLTYFPRYNFADYDNSSLSVGIPLSAGIGVFNNSLVSDAGIGFSYDIPVAIDYNIGHNSTKSNESNFGGYFGIGFGYYSVILSGSKFSDFKGTTYGPMARAGVRIGGKGSMTIGLFYKKGLEAEKYSTIGCNILLDL